MQVNRFSPDKLYSGRDLRRTAPEGIYSQRRSTNSLRYWVVLHKDNNPALPRTVFTIYNDQVGAVAKLDEYAEFVRLPNAFLRISVGTI